MSRLFNQTCTVCTKDTPRIEGDKIETYVTELSLGWHIVHEHHLEKEFHFNDFKTALAFTNKVGVLAENEKHHPDIHLSWGKVRIVLWTHVINGLGKNDFILASKIDRIT